MRYSDNDIRATLAARIAGSSLRSVARELDVTPGYLSQVMTLKLPPSARLAQAAGFKEDGLRWVKIERKARA